MASQNTAALPKQGKYFEESGSSPPLPAGGPSDVPDTSVATNVSDRDGEEAADA